MALPAKCVIVLQYAEIGGGRLHMHMPQPLDKFTLLPRPLPGLSVSLGYPTVTSVLSFPGGVDRRGPGSTGISHPRFGSRS